MEERLAHPEKTRSVSNAAPILHWIRGWRMLNAEYILTGNRRAKGPVDDRFL
jgi:hypothetical protein